jgi:leucyl-tRNA synthetase
LPGFGYVDYKVSNEMSFGNAKQMRKQPTVAENILWNALKNKGIGYKFRRQHPVESYIVDFICLDVWVAVEVDGGYHTSAEQIALDTERDAILSRIGFTTLHFTNNEVINNLEGVLATIKKACEERKNSSRDKLSQQSTYQISAGSSPLQGEAGVRVYTTRPDTIFGVDFMVIAPEHELVEQITAEAQKTAVGEYIAYVKSRSDRERQAEKKITGCFTGACAVNPFDGREIPIWISEYVLAGYGTGAIMAVPCGDERDFKFARHFNIPVTNIIGTHFNGEEANPTKDAVLENSGFLNGMPMRKAIDEVCNKIEELGIGKRKVNYKMRDAAFSRQRYWGEPFPIIWKDGIAYPLDESGLPLELPHVDSYKPGSDGEGPLANIETWTAQHLETNTMPGYAGSSWYFLRYMDPHNGSEFCDRKVSDYWGQVDLYIGGTEHAVGHLLYSRMWTKCLYDLGYIGHDEPYKKLVNQGMIQGSSRFVYRLHGTNKFISYNLITDFESVDKLHVNVNFVEGYELDINAFKNWKDEFADALFELEDDKYICGFEVEKMSKRYYNVVNPDDIVTKYGADTYRMYEMFLGPVEQSKPWDTKGIEGVHRFLRKLWRLFFDEIKGRVWTEAKATDAEFKVLHKAIKKIEEDTGRFSFNTAVSAFMVCVNDLADLKCSKKEILEPLLVMLAPYAPHITEELWGVLGNTTSILEVAYPAHNPAYLVESSKEYPVSVNGKLRTTINLPLDLSKEQVEETVLANEVIKKWLEGNPPKKVIYVPGKMVNVVV